jgi:hypothetical protein
MHGVLLHSHGLRMRSHSSAALPFPRSRETASCPMPCHPLTSRHGQTPLKARDAWNSRAYPAKFVGCRYHAWGATGTRVCVCLVLLHTHTRQLARVRRGAGRSDRRACVARRGAACSDRRARRDASETHGPNRDAPTRPRAHLHLLGPAATVRAQRLRAKSRERD